MNKVIKPDPDNLQLICKKCFTLISELEELQSRVAEIKNEILVQHGSESDLIKQEHEENQDEVDRENDTPRKLLFIPSSDDDSTQVSTGFIVVKK